MNRLLILIVIVALALPGYGQRRPEHIHPGQERMGQVMHPLLRKVLDLREKVRMSGVRVVQHLDQGERKLVTERILRDGLRMKIVTEDGPGKGTESVEDSRRRLVWNPKSNEIRETAAREAEFFLRFGRMGKRGRNGGFKESAGGFVAGIDTRLIEIGGQGEKVVSRVWVDPVHGAVLKMQAFDPKGNLNGSMEFTSVQFNPTIAAGSFEINKHGARFVSTSDDLKRIARELGMRPYRLPDDGQWKLIGVRKLTPKGVKVLMQAYFGPEARVSLFQIQGDIDAEKLKKMEGKGTNNYVWSVNGVRLVLIGNLSTDVLRRLADRVSV